MNKTGLTMITLKSLRSIGTFYNIFLKDVMYISNKDNSYGKACIFLVVNMPFPNPADQIVQFQNYITIPGQLYP